MIRFLSDPQIYIQPRPIQRNIYPEAVGHPSGNLLAVATCTPETRPLAVDAASKCLTIIVVLYLFFVIAQDSGIGKITSSCSTQTHNRPTSFVIRSQSPVEGLSFCQDIN